MIEIKVGYTSASGLVFNLFDSASQRIKRIKDNKDNLLVIYPEAGLHPVESMTLMDAVIDIHQSQKLVRIISFSEAMISRLQRRIAEGRIRNSDVKIICQEIVPLDKFGMFKKLGSEGKRFFFAGLNESKSMLHEYQLLRN